MDNQNKWCDLLKAAVTEPGLILKAYSNFHGYSLSNQVAALVQCQQRGIEPGPINTYQGWQNLNRQVKKGEKAIWLCMPLTRKKKGDQKDDEEVITCFVWKPRRFILAQTEGEPVPMPPTPDWDKAGALANLNIEEVEFDLLDGNTMGYASKRQVAISPLCPLPHKTLFHEMAHLCCLHSYVLLIAQVLWNEVSLGFEPHITFLCIHPVVIFTDVAFCYPTSGTVNRH